MDSIFITNAPGQPNLKNRINELAEKAEELKFLVGFFYFTGIEELYKGLAANDHVILKILVGLNTDRINNQLIEYGHYDPSASINEKIDRFIKDVRLTLNGEDFDNKDYYERFGLFLQMIRDDRLIIRKTREPNHAKLYISIDHDNVHSERTFVTGSSNLTRAGLSGQAEFNVELSSLGAPEKAEEFFDQLWADSIKITEDDTVKNRLLKLLEKETLTREVTPFEAYALSLKSYLDVYNPDFRLGDSVLNAFTKGGYTPYKYQLDAIKQALNIINQNHGVIIADVVGLGKSVIASAIGKALGKRGIVLCPPGLMGDDNHNSGWKMYINQFKLFGWEVRSIGKLESVSEFINNNPDFEVVIVDEAHRFRNQDTADYEHLKNICRGKKVILLTATPFNNKPKDILSLLNLFMPSRQSSITLDPDIGKKFQRFDSDYDKLSKILRNHNSIDPVKRAKAISQYESIFGLETVDTKKVKMQMTSISKEIRDIIAPVTIRRNRLDLSHNPDYATEVNNLSKIHDPIEWFFELSTEQSDFYNKIVSYYFGAEGKFTGAVYQPAYYEISNSDPDADSEKPDHLERLSQANLSDFMRRLLVKRFESSFGSFEQSILRFKKLYESALKFIETSGKYIIDRILLDKYADEDEEIIEDLLKDYQEKLDQGGETKNDKVYKVNEFELKDAFIQDIKSDLVMFDEIIKQLNEMDLVNDDPKSGCLIEKIQEQMLQPAGPNEPKRKIIIFSEYADTVHHLKTALTPMFGDELLVVDGNLSVKTINTINENFDASHLQPKDDYQILLATDRISEGFNLNRAGMIINYDIPWNPVRVIQRVGRINRISKKVFDELFIVNFFPSEIGATYVKSKEIAAAKMYLIHNTLGEDSKIFDTEEEPSEAALYTRINSFDEEEDESFYTKMLKRWNKLVTDDPDLEQKLKEFPQRVKVAKSFGKNELLILFKKNRLFIQRLSDGDEKPVLVPFEDALESIECDSDEARIPLSSDFWGKYAIAKTIYPEPGGKGYKSQSVEQKAYTLLHNLCNLKIPEFSEYQEFIETLYEDMKDWSTLPKFTTRTISNLKWNTSGQIVKTLNTLRDLYIQLGPDYLDKEKERSNQIQQEIVIAVENQKL